MTESPTGRPLIATGAREDSGAFSPDGKWLLFTSDESGLREIYVVPFPGPGEKRQVSTSGAIYGVWLGPSSILFAQPPEGKLFVVDLEARGSSLLVGPARPVFGGKPIPRGPWDIWRDGKRLLVAVPVDEDGATELRIVSDWRAELAKK